MQGQHFLPSRTRVSTCSYWRLEWAAWVSTWSGRTASSSTIPTGIPAPTCRRVSGRGGSGRNARSRYTDSSLPAPLRRKYTTGTQDTCNFVTTHILMRKYTTGTQDTCNFVTTYILRRKYTTGRQDTYNFVTTHILRRKYTTGRQDTCNFVTTHMKPAQLCVLLMLVL